MLPAATAQEQVPPAPIEPNRPSFAEWLAGVRSEAIARGIREEIVDEALQTVEEPLPIVIERDRSQAETVLSLETYIARHVTPKVVKTARQMMATHRALLERIGARYGVSPRIIVGVWGLESNFGQFSGTRPTIAALATLAWDPRRSALFRGELFAALEILNRGDTDLARMQGSWAGAMGQPQFMPSSYLQYAQDFDGDGHSDIWSSPADVFASVANYLRGHGWAAGQSWGREVRLSREAARHVATDIDRRNGSCGAMRDMTVARSAKEWRRAGVRLPGGGALPLTTPAASLVSGSTKHYLVYPNYDALLGYNCANAYALTVGLLADRLSAQTSARTPQRRPG
jgi:membrane-bound lytic murein transglycosylase B